MSPLEAQQPCPRLVSDIYEGLDLALDNGIENLTAFGDRVVFTADSSLYGHELWISDGTENGTTLVRDIAPGQASSMPEEITVVGTSFYFTASTKSLSRQLWVSDGTEAGTRLVIDSPTNTLFNPESLTEHLGLLFFTAKDENGIELWVSDGTNDGTNMVTDPTPGQSSSFPFNLTSIGSEIFYYSNGFFGGGLWKSDGTEEGTTLIKLLSPSREKPEFLAANDGRFYFATSQSELWISDGTSEGTKLIKDLSSRDPDDPIVASLFGDSVIFVAEEGRSGREPWISDGTEVGTFQLKDCYTGRAGSDPDDITILGDSFFFTATSAETGRELWISDGTSDGTRLVKDILPGEPGRSFSSSPSNLHVMEETLYFSATTDLGIELWKSDGTSEGTQLVKDLNLGATSSSPESLRSIKSLLFFVASTEREGKELWLSDGTDVGTYLVHDIYEGTASSDPRNLTIAGSSIFYVAKSADLGSELWSTNLESGKTSVAKNILLENYSSSPAQLTTAGSQVFFTANDGKSGQELWVFDNTASETRLVKDINSAPSGSFPKEIVSLGETVLFLATTEESGQVLWRSDGTNEGTVLIKDFETDTTKDDFAEFFVASTTPPLVYFSANDGVHGFELWKSDGTVEGTTLVSDIFPGQESGEPSGFVKFRDDLFFSANNGALGHELWRLNIETSSLQLVKDIWVGPNASTPEWLSVVDDKILFVADDSIYGRELWESDGSSEGTKLLKIFTLNRLPDIIESLTAAEDSAFISTDVSLSVGRSDLWHYDSSSGEVLPLRQFQSLKNLTPIGDKLYFNALSDLGRELWISNGTYEGTQVVKDINVMGSSDPDNINAGESGIYFTADDGVHGTELWITDGSSAGTNMVSDLYPGPSSSSPSNFTFLGSTLFFTATESTFGTELYSFDPSQPCLPKLSVSPATNITNNSASISGSFGDLTAFATPAAAITILLEYGTNRSYDIQFPQALFLSDENPNSEFTFRVDDLLENTEYQYRVSAFISNGGANSEFYTIPPTPSQALRTLGNSPPVTPDYRFSTTYGTPALVYYSKLKSRYSDPDGDDISAVWAEQSLQGGLVILAEHGIIYIPPKNFHGEDSFMVYSSDHLGAESAGLVQVTVGSPFGDSGNRPRIKFIDGGLSEMTFHVIPGRVYGVFRSTDMITWEKVYSATANAQGKLIFVDDPDDMEKAFYRIAPD